MTSRNIHTLAVCIFIISAGAAAQSLPIPAWAKALLQGAISTATYIRGLYDDRPGTKGE